MGGSELFRLPKRWRRPFRASPRSRAIGLPERLVFSTLVHALEYYSYVVFKDPNRDWHRLKFDSDVELANKVDNDTINAVGPNLSEFVAHGGKLPMYHGWAESSGTEIRPRKGRHRSESSRRSLDTVSSHLRSISGSIRGRLGQTFDSESNGYDIPPFDTLGRHDTGQWLRGCVARQAQ